MWKVLQRANSVFLSLNRPQATDDLQQVGATKQLLALIKLVNEDFQGEVGHALTFTLQSSSLLKQSVQPFVQLPDYHVLIPVLLSKAHH